jgi:hypothetical protein
MLLRRAPLLLALSLLTSGCDGPRRVRVGVVGCNRRAPISLSGSSASPTTSTRVGRREGSVGRDARVRVQRVGKPDGTEIRIWRAHERVSVKRATAEEGKR